MLIITFFFLIVTVGFFLLMEKTFPKNLKLIDQKMKENTDF